MLQLTACAVACSLLACAFGTVGAPDHPRPGIAPECTESYTAPVLEASIGAIVGGLGLYYATRSECPERGGGEPCDAFSGHLTRGFGSLLLVTGLIFVGGSLVGFSRVSSCKTAVATYRASASRP
ncbi:MAG: hypothetical protein ABI175_08740 [Polyangiales bacterium]